MTCLYPLSHKGVSEKLRKLELKCNRKFRDIAAAIQFLWQKDQVQTRQRKRRPIGFKNSTAS